ncbi:hypothetical protein [Cohnella hongkongensis]|uniref:Uncharacterized protein n=1 Tax=Cohnella hongkongensis TaxID=178337 RepID=A0ABV9FIP5_9BACL
MSKQVKAVGARPAKHRKAALLASKRFTAVEKDLLRGLLGDDESYTVQEAAAIVEKNLKREAE